MRNKVVISALAVLFVFSMASLTGCKEKDDGKITIGSNMYSFQDNFMNGVMKPAMEAYAIEKGVDIQIVDSEGQQAILNNQIDVYITKKVDVLAINLVDPASAQSVIDKAKKAGIPLILFNKEGTKEAMASYDKVWYVGTDSAESGIIQGEMMVADWKANPDWDKNGDGTVQFVMLQGEPGHPDAEARTKESVKAFEDAGIAVEKLAHEADPNWSTQFGNDKLAAWLTSSFGKNIELVICNNDGMAFGAITAMKAARTRLPIYGVDALAQALTHIADGELDGTVLNDGVNQGKATIDLAINAAMGKDVVEGTSWDVTTDGAKAVRVAYVAVTPENYKDFQ